MNKKIIITPPKTFEDIIIKNSHIPEWLFDVLSKKYKIFDLQSQINNKKPIIYILNSTAFNTLKQKTWNEIHALLIYDYHTISEQQNNQIYINPWLEYYTLKYESWKIILTSKTRKKSDRSDRVIKHFLIYGKEDSTWALLTRKQ